jgi:hypothetical protein
MQLGIRPRISPPMLGLALAVSTAALAADDGHHPGHHDAGAAAVVKDERAAIALSADERAAVLAEMRAFLQSVQGIAGAVASGKVAAAADAAKPSGMGAAHAMPKSLMGKLPMEFRKLGMDTHQRFDALALEASGLGDGKVVLTQLEQILANCNGCHAGYRFTGE